MVVLNAQKEEEGVLNLAINRIVEILWPQTVPDKQLVENTGRAGGLKLDVFDRRGMDDMQRSAWETSAGVFTTVPASPKLFPTYSNFWFRPAVFFCLVFTFLCYSADQLLLWEVYRRSVL